MKRGDIASASNVVPSGRITRSKAAACNADVKISHLKPPLPKPTLRQRQLGKTKRDENGYAAPTAASQCKKRAVLKDVTNICFNSAKGCVNVTKSQVKVSEILKPCNSNAKLSSKHSGEKINNLAPDIYVESTLVPEYKADGCLPDAGVLGSQESIISSNVNEINSSLGQENFQKCTDQIEQYNLRREHELSCQTDNVDCKDHGNSSCLEIVDIDSEHTNPLMCSSYSCEINNHQRAAELLRRPCYKFMETVQKDINQNMRSILIDWLVEVSDEYRLVPDTLYLTVNFIDRYLSESCIERQRLQLLGITCMLIASKYEEICAPPIEQFCSITDNTYTRAEVIKMEADVLKLLHFQLSVPTIKTFLRRFIRVANALYKVPPPALSHLANYLAELALIEYNFLKFLPSVIAASSIFLARWTIEQSDRPWNETLEHYTSYKTSELKPTIIALQDLQMNKSNCPLTAIREKYKQSKFMSVATMMSPDLQPSLFADQ